MPTTVGVAGALAFAAVVAYLLAALVAEAPRAGSPLPAPPLPATVRRVLNTTPRKAVAGVAAVAVLVVVVAVWDSRYVPLALVLVLGVPAAYTDARELRLPDELTYTLAAATTVTVLVLHLTGGGDGTLRALLSGAGYSLALLLFALFAPAGRGRAAEAGSVGATTAAALGLGDIKLAVGLGVALGWTSVTAVTAALFLTATTHLLWLLTVTVTRRAGRSQGMAATALGPWMVLGAATTLALSLP